MPRRAAFGRPVASVALVIVLVTVAAGSGPTRAGGPSSPSPWTAGGPGGQVVPMVLTVASFRFVPSQIDLGMAVSGIVVLHGATGWVRFNYSGLPPGCPSVNASTFTCTPTAVGGYVVTVVATSAGGSSAQTAAVVTIVPALAITAVASSPSPAVVGSNLEVWTTVSGGTPRFSFAYTGLPPGCISVNRAGFNCTPTGSGTYAVGVTVRDGAGGSAQANVTIAVEPAPVPPPASFWNTTDLLGVVAVIAAAVALSVGFLWWRRRRPPRPSGMPAGPGPTGRAP